MPIYAYKCSSCQNEFDVLQKISDAPLSVCPRCGAATLSKQLTAAGFHLKGSGWYATDFKNGTPADAKPATKPAEATPAQGAPTPAKESAPAKEAPAAAPSGAGGGSAAGS